MANYTFAAERQLIFHVNVSGRTRLVQFGERNMSGASSFLTTDSGIAAAIRRHSMFRRGAIKETTVKAAADDTPHPVRQSVLEGRGAHLPGIGSAPSGADVLEADNFTQAKEVIIKRFGVTKSDVKTPALLAKTAKEHGITIKYREK